MQYGRVPQFPEYLKVKSKGDKLDTKFVQFARS